MRFHRHLRRVLLILLAACTVLAQGAAGRHGFEHLRAGGDGRDHFAVDAGGQHECALCLAFTGLGACAPSGGFVASTLAGASVVPSGNDGPSPAAARDAYLARAPPRVV
ncbi:hypothetical protein G3580_00815 [Nitrogeniibacter mangrovi]|uniref:DUF2946 domain-containing protein n=1 Tax=Nitrogeniibacter mangrovi TaxID=2016596 RepID=A0A6C1AY51_9RHOO|nr:hypothetical protein [Nitrogeniibacter mangrovi]QID16291.1 hypothetical protein G3580_00815 [Nitrogeniibacter mangrovi]